MRQSSIRNILSVQNPHVKEIVRLRDRRFRDRKKLYLIEGYREFSLALQGRAALKALYFCRDFFLGENEDLLIKEASEKGAEIYELSPSAFQKISYRDRPDGILGVAYQDPRSLEELIAVLQTKKDLFLLVVEGVEKPGNLGSIIRSADGGGVDAVLLCDRGTDFYNPNVVRASVGTFFSVPIFEITSQDALELLKSYGVSILATSPQAKVAYYQLDYRRSIALVVGREQVGLSEMWIEGADHLVSIPMHGMADSLNVSNATAILLYEVVRQRSSI